MLREHVLVVGISLNLLIDSIIHANTHAVTEGVVWVALIAHILIIQPTSPIFLLGKFE